MGEELDGENLEKPIAGQAAVQARVDEITGLKRDFDGESDVEFQKRLSDMPNALLQRVAADPEPSQF